MVWYIVASVVPGLCLLGIAMRGWYALAVPVILFGVIPVIEVLVGTRTRNLTDEEEAAALAHPGHDRAMYLAIAIHVAALAVFLWSTSTVAMGAVELGSVILAMGISCGVVGINVAHELGHRSTRGEQNLAKMLLLTSLYQHFFIEHNRGHHAKVATPEDPATARYGESLVTFLPRTFVGSWIDAWRLENGRLRNRGERVVSWKNEMVRYQVYQAAFVAAIGFGLGVTAVLSFVAAAFMGAVFLETVNYIEHYGLIRRRRDNGKYEKTLPIHSWNSDHLIGRLLLFELTRHSDHHSNPKRPYPVLRHFDESPQLPLGYPGMVVLSFVPPLFFWVMHRRIEKLSHELKEPAFA
jgi:alkane 1-monooxygenase